MRARAAIAAAFCVTLLSLTGEQAAGRPTSVTANTFTGGYGPVWSPDGTQLAYIGPTRNSNDSGSLGLDRVIVVNADGSGAPQTVAVAPRSEALEEVRWAAGGRFLYQDSNYTLWSDTGSRGKAARRVGFVGPTGGVGEAFALSRDGREVAFTAPCGCRIAQGTSVHFATNLLRPPAGLCAVCRGRRTRSTATRVSPRTASNSSSRVSALVPAHRSGRRTSRSSPVATGGPSVRCMSTETGLPSPRTGAGSRSSLAPASKSCPPRAADHARCFRSSTSTAPRASPGRPTRHSSCTQADEGRDGRSHRPRDELRDPWPAPGRQHAAVVPDGKTIAFSAVKKGDDLDIRVYLIGADGSGLRRLA